MYLVGSFLQQKELVYDVLGYALISFPPNKKATTTCNPIILVVWSPYNLEPDFMIRPTYKKPNCTLY